MMLLPLDTIRRWGNYCSDAVLDPKTRYFEKEGLEGLIGYRTEEGINVVYGDPVAPQNTQGALAEAFENYSDHSGQGVIYICTSPEFSEWMAERLGYKKLEFGEEIFFDPKKDPQKETGDRASLLRRKVRRAEKYGVSFNELTFNDLERRQELESLADAWLKGRAGLQVHISHVHLFDNVEGKRWFWAKQNEKAVGVGVANRLESKNGWLMNHLMMHPDAPNGTTELLVTSMLKILEEDGADYVTVGSVPRESLGEIKNLPPVAKWLAQRGYKLASRYLNLSAKKKYWEKFSPESKGTFLLFDNNSLSTRNLKALFKALNIKSTDLFN
ncbi:MAG: DUF2156 domain-containing protein [Chlamydiia bacterium]|nr:DUF2156 domain-containing protein [Chlamydiia bacterium]